MRLPTLTGATVLLVLTLGCVREPREWECPTAQPGDLVVSEIRGEQSGADQYGQWLEIYNATDAEHELFGLQVRLRHRSGAPDLVWVRDAALVVPARGYVVLGRVPPSTDAPHVDYSYYLDFDGSLPDSGVIELWACDRMLDQAPYDALPATGTWTLSGATEPDATLNDDKGMWCNDTTPAGDPGYGLPGTPGERNLSCV